MKPEHKNLIADASILLVVSVCLVLFLNNVVFSRLKHDNSDSLVTAIQQDNTNRVAEILGEKEYETQRKDYPTHQAYKKARAARTDEIGRTAMMWVAYANNRDQEITAKCDDARLPMVTLLVDAGADLNARDRDGWTALMWASWSNLPKVTAKLLALGADVNAADRLGNTALTLAALQGHGGMVALLLQKGANKALATKAGKTAGALAAEGLKKNPGKAAAYSAVLSALR